MAAGRVAHLLETTNMTHAQRRRRIERVLAHYRPLLGLDGWHLAITFHEKRGDIQNSGERAAAACSADPEYQSAELQFVLEEMRPDVLDRTVLHELCHILTWPLVHMVDWLRDRYCEKDAGVQEMERLAIESVTTTLERLFWQTLPRCK